MKTTIKLLSVAAATLLGCGDNKSVPDARIPDGPPPDAYCSDCPAAPALGAQIDRVGRPAVNTVLNRGFDAPQVGGAAKDAYNENADPSTWGSYIPEFMSNLAMVDVLDSGICGNGICEIGERNGMAGDPGVCNADCGAGQVGGSCGNGVCEIGETNANCEDDCPDENQVGTAGNGCGNQVLYNPNAPAGTGYGPLATLLSNDVLFLDTSRGACQFYLAVEFGVVTTVGNSTCGGRAPQYDVIDYSFSMLAMGLQGFDASLQPLIQDNAAPHTDYLTDFPYLGEPHPAP